MFLPTQNLVNVCNLVIVSDKSTNHQSQNLDYILNALIQKEKIRQQVDLGIFIFDQWFEVM